MVGLRSQGPQQQLCVAQAPGKVGAVTCTCSRTLSRDGSSSNLHVPLESWMAASARACTWSSCRHCTAASEHAEIEAPMAGPPVSLYIPQQWCLASLAGPGFFSDSLSGSALHPSPLRLSSHSQPQSSPQGLTSETPASVPSPTHPSPQWTSRQASQAGECLSAPTLCIGLSPLCPLHTCCCALLQGSKAPPLSSLISLPARGFLNVQKPFLFHSSLPEVQVPSLFLSLFFSFFFCPTQLCRDCLVLLEV